MQMSAKNTNIVYLTATHDAPAGEVVKVSKEDAERLIAQGHARAPREGEVKAAKD